MNRQRRKLVRVGCAWVGLLKGKCCKQQVNHEYLKVHADWSRYVLIGRGTYLLEHVTSE